MSDRLRFDRTASVLSFAVLLLVAGCIGFSSPFGAEPWGFDEVTEQAGLEYQGRASGIGNGNAGVYVTDFNNDGWSDVLTIGGEKPVLWENSDGRFERARQLPELSIRVQGALFFDADGDGWEDLLLLPRNDHAVFLKNDHGTFTVHPNGLNVPLGVAVGATTADYDVDGDLDVFVIQYGDWGKRTPKGYLNPERGVIDEDNGEKNLLFQNTNDGFERVTDSGIAGERWSLATSFVDFTGDGLPDIHVANDFNYDTYYVNSGNGSFERRQLGRATARNGMSSEVGYFNPDARPDVFVTNIYFPIGESNLSEEKRARLQRYFSFVLRSKRIKGNTLLINQDGNSFVDRGEEFGLRQGGWGWAAIFSDFNNDMRRDLFHTTQNVIRFNREDPVYTVPQIWMGDQKGFNRIDSSARGFDETNGRGAAELDYDRDGDMDILVATYDGPYRLYANTVDTHRGRNSIQLRIVGVNGNSRGIGARVRVTVAGTKINAINNAKADYQSQDTRTIHVGLGKNDSVDAIKVTWPSGYSRTIRDVEANQVVIISPNVTRTRDFQS